jgi:hypothetical protein
MMLRLAELLFGTLVNAVMMGPRPAERHCERIKQRRSDGPSLQPTV